MFYLMLPPAMPVAGWLALLTCSLLAVWICRDELRAAGVLHPRAVRFGIALLLAGLGGVTLLAQSPIYIECRWEVLLDLCGGNEACAWVAYWLNGCPFIVG